MADIGKGIFGGASTGAGVGSQFGPWGAGVGAVLGGIAGGIQGGNAKKLQSEADRAQKAINPIDPNLVAFQNRLRQQERQYRAGTDPSSAFAAMNARNVGTQTQNNLLRAGGPNTVSQLLRAQAGTNNAFAGIGAQAAAGADRMLGAQGTLAGTLAERKYQYDREMRNIAQSRATAARQDVNNLAAGGMAMIPQLGVQFAQGAPMAPQRANGGFVGNTYVPGINPGVSYGGMGTGTQQPTFGFGGWNTKPNYGLQY